ncbi:cyclin, partial [Aureobasidium melanogenum]
MAPVIGLSHITNPLATPDQLQTTASQLDRIPADLEISIKFEGSRLIQAAGILLHLPQELIAEAIIVFSRFWLGPEGGSLAEYAAKDVIAASLYLVTKPSAHPVSPRRLLSVLAYLNKVRPSLDLESASQVTPEDCFLSEGTYQDGRLALIHTEAQMLRILGYQTHVSLPYAICINYLQALDVFTTSENGQALAKRAFAHLNSALFSPQLLYLTHQPPSLATAAIYLAAKEIGVKLPGEEWWEVFDVDREELGFLVVALISMEGFIAEEVQKWDKSKVPLTLEDTQVWIDKEARI